ncbi:DUF1501 domain-containing protein [Nakamurella sp. A5-74]|uniref:DUF1501 domain-containing protein n=1 Tax=Nakamurella sp. A5-74 TaxID=3158264 RepID=A0AAU8DU21_9ACTN
MTDPIAPAAPDGVLASLHPDCPDWRRLGPTPRDAAVRALGAAVEIDAQNRDQQWSKGFTRRRLIQGGAAVGVASIASQLVTSRVSFAANAAAIPGTLIVVFLRGGMDGLSVLQPASAATGLNVLAGKRSRLLSPTSKLLTLTGGLAGFGLHPSLAALKPLIAAGRFAAIPAVSTPDVSRSHFQAQDCLERGGSGETGTGTGWLDRVLQQSGAGTTFRAVASSSRLPRSLVGSNNAVVVPDLSEMSLDTDQPAATIAALRSLYTGVGGPTGLQASIALGASVTASALAAREKADIEANRRPVYPANSFAGDLRTLATMISANIGVRVGSIDVGGWDMHTDLIGDMPTLLKSVADGLSVFFRDLGAKADTTTVVVMSEFGRRMEQNDNAGADHGHGGVALVMGGGVRGGVRGRWAGLGPSVLDHGDVPGTNDYRTVLGEVVGKRLGLTASQVGQVFPGFPIGGLRLGVMR